MLNNIQWLINHDTTMESKLDGPTTAFTYLTGRVRDLSQFAVLDLVWPVLKCSISP